jgi:hypothetical protein
MSTRTPDALDPLINALANTQAGWVTRRDAAEALGAAAQKACGALDKHREDADVDVRRAVQQAIAAVHKPAPAEKLSPPSLRELVEPLARPGRREVVQEADGYAITLQLKGERRQKILVQPVTRKDGKEIIRVFTWCGEATPEKYEWLLRSNTRLSYCAFTLLEEQGVLRVALVASLSRDRATTAKVKSAVKEMAFYGDWLEQQTSTADQF